MQNIADLATPSVLSAYWVSIQLSFAAELFGFWGLSAVYLYSQIPLMVLRGVAWRTNPLNCVADRDSVYSVCTEY